MSPLLSGSESRGLLPACRLLIAVQTTLLAGRALASAIGPELAVCASFAAATWITRPRRRPRSASPLSAPPHIAAQPRSAWSRIAWSRSAWPRIAWPRSAWPRSASPRIARLAAAAVAGWLLQPWLTLAIVTIGAALGLGAPPLAAGPTPAGVWLAALLLAPVFEERLYRGVLLEALRARFGAAPAVALSSVAFALPHVHPWPLLGATLVGCGLGALRLRTRGLATCIGLHAGLNARLFW